MCSECFDMKMHEVSALIAFLLRVMTSKEVIRVQEVVVTVEIQNHGKESVGAKSIVILYR